jgi:hypothetical protein
LRARREFVDTGWVEWLEQAAIRQEEQGNLQGANQIYNLRDYAAMLVALETVKITAPLWNELWQAILQSNCNPQVIEPRSLKELLSVAPPQKSLNKTQNKGLEQKLLAMLLPRLYVIGSYQG